MHVHAAENPSIGSDGEQADLPHVGSSPRSIKITAWSVPARRPGNGWRLHQSKRNNSRSTQPAFGELQRGSHGGGEPAGGLQLHAGEEALGRALAAVAQLGAVGGAAALGVDDGCALEAVRPMAGLQLQPGLVVAPGAVGQRHDGLLAALQALAAGQQRHALDEAPSRVVVHARGESAKNGALKSDEEAEMDDTTGSSKVDARCLERPLSAELQQETRPLLFVENYSAN